MSASVVFAAIIVAGLGLVYHLWRGGGFFRLIVSIGAAGLGFAIGQLVGQFFGWQLVMIGEVHLAEGLIGALIMLVLVNKPA
jgi:hypothetical protein